MGDIKPVDLIQHLWPKATLIRGRTSEYPWNDTLDPRQEESQTHRLLQCCGCGENFSVNVTLPGRNSRAFAYCRLCRPGLYR